MEDELECEVCLEMFDNPIMLDCDHTFCLKCALLLRENDTSTTCPLCRQVTTASSGSTNGYYGFRRNLALTKVIDSFKKASFSSTPHTVDAHPEDQTSANANCATHNERLDFFCTDCKEPVCSHCILLASHKGHSYVAVAEASKAVMGRITEKLSTLDQRAKNLNITIEKLDAAQEQLTTAADQVLTICNSVVCRLQSNHTFLQPQYFRWLPT